MLFSKDRIGGLILLVFCVSYGFLSQQIVLLPFQAKAAFHARTMPEILTVLGIALSLMVIFKPGSGEMPKLGKQNWLVAGLFLALMSLYGLTIRPFGFIFSTSVFLIAGFALLGERSVMKLLLIALPLVVGFWVLMTQGLDVFIEPFPWFMQGD